jgi:HEAT repeat protein
LAGCPPVRVTDVLVCPLVSIGGWKQLVLLPSRLLAELSREQTQSVLAHELAHIRRRDHWVRCFELIVLALFWWNPIAWWASRRLRQAEEECCDAWVVWALPECRRSYGQALLRTVEILTEGRVIAPIAGSGFGKHLFTRRIEMIMQNQFPRSLPWWGVLGLVSISCLILPWTVQPITAVEAQESEEQAVAVRQPNSAEEAPVSKQALRYDGKDFNWWRVQLLIELKAELRVEALKAMGVFGANGYAEHAAVAIIEVVKSYEIQSRNSDDQKVIGAAATALRKIGPPAVKSLIAAVKGENINARQFAVSLLRRSVPNEAVVAALIAATEDDNPQVRRSAVNALPTHGKDVVSALTKALKDEDLETRYFAARALGQMEPTAVNAVPALITAAKDDEHRFMRQNALAALARIQPDPNVVVPLLIQTLKDKDPSVRRITIEYLGEIGPKAKAAVPALIEAFSDIDRHDRVLVARALGQIGPEAKQAITVITKALQDEDKNLQRVAVEALKKITR